MALKVAVLISGGGTNLQALIDAFRTPQSPAEIVLVISNRDHAGGLQRAAAAAIPTRVIDHRPFADRAAFDAAMHDALTAGGAELVCLAGFMRLLGAQFAEQWGNRLINIHPSLLPAFKGLHAHEQVLAAGVRISGCTVHFVRPAMDDGPIIVQAAVPVLADDTHRSLAARVLAAEHRCYPLAVRLIAEGRVTVRDNKVFIDGEAPPSRVMLNPSDA